MSQQKNKRTIIAFFVPCFFDRREDCAEPGKRNLWQISFKHCWPMFIFPSLQLPAVHPGQAHKTIQKPGKYYIT